MLQQLGRLRAAGLDLAHVRDVEHARRGTHREVLGPDARVLHRHLPARRTDQLRARRAMAVVQGRMAQGVGGRGHLGQASSGAAGGQMARGQALRR